jgi:hypothetical protein
MKAKGDRKRNRIAKVTPVTMRIFRALLTRGGLDEDGCM